MSWNSWWLFCMWKERKLWAGWLGGWVAAEVVGAGRSHSWLSTKLKLPLTLFLNKAPRIAKVNPIWPAFFPLITTTLLSRPYTGGIACMY